MVEARRKQTAANGNGATANASPAPAETNVLIGKMQMGLMALEHKKGRVGGPASVGVDNPVQLPVLTGCGPALPPPWAAASRPARLDSTILFYAPD